MAVMFYSLQEAAERLGKTEDQIRAVVQSGQLREFRDGPNLLFKVDEVDALIADSGIAPSQGRPKPRTARPQSPATQAGRRPPVPKMEIPQDEVPLEFDIPEARAAAPHPETPQVFEPAEPDFDVPLEFDAPLAEAPQMEMPQLEVPEAGFAEGEIPAELEAPEMEISDLEISELETPIPQEPAGTSEILLAPESGAPDAPSELTNADTAITGEGVSVLGETDKDYAISDDTLGETIGSMGLASTGTTPDASLEEIEGDVNLDSFGSGSGLLDLSLQADDTSLGGILDEIYTAEEEPAEAADPGTVAEVTAEVDQMADDELVAAQADLALPGLAQARFEAEPDNASNILGAMLFVPLFFVLYTAMVAVGGLRGVIPSLLSATQGFIWYIVIGFSVVTVGISLYAIFMADKEAAPATKKAERPKAPKKAEKTKKAEKPKKAKK